MDKRLNLVSVIIPTFNSSRWIKEAIDSVLDQTYKNIEIIVVDDGSTDSTKKVLDNYIDKNQIYYYYINNSGPAAARNFGIKKSKGDLISFLDSDDLWIKDKIEKQLNFLTDNPEIDLLLTNIEVINAHGQTLYFHKNKLPKETKQIIKAFFNSKIIMNTPTILFKRHILEKVGGFDNSLRYREDHMFLMDIASSYKIAILNEYTIKRRIINTSASHSLNAKELLSAQMPFIELATSKYKFLNRKVEIARIYFEISKDRSMSKKGKLKYGFYSMMNYPLNWKTYIVLLSELLFLNLNYRKIKMIKRR